MSLDVMNSFDRAGIKGVSVDGVGVPFTLTSASASGTDWTHSMAPSVPEPETYALTILGLRSLFAAVRRRRSRRA